MKFIVVSETIIYSKSYNPLRIFTLPLNSGTIEISINENRNRFRAQIKIHVLFYL